MAVLSPRCNVALKQMNTKGLAQLTGMHFIPVSCANMLIIGNISATATIVGSCEKAH